MGITQRQEQILNSLVQEYIGGAEPVSSEFLEKKYNFGFCPATIRAEFQKLTERGYLEKPYTSAGRVPTNKGYRFFVNRLLEMDFEQDFFPEDFLEIEREEIFKFVENITKKLACFSSGLALTYLFEKDFLWKDGWKDVFENPEFRKIECLEDFLKTVDGLEKNIKKFTPHHECLGCEPEDEWFNIPKGSALKPWALAHGAGFTEKNLPEINIFIGREKSFLNSRDFSLIISKSQFPGNQRGFLAILGPKRMAYDKNINLIHSLIEEIEKL